MTVNVTWERTPNYDSGREAHRIVAIVSHITSAPDAASTINWFGSPVSRVSAHYLIDIDGAIFQFVHANDTAWHAGEITNPDLNIAWLAHAVAASVNPNLLTIGIEHVGFTGRPMPELQYAASLRLQKYLTGGYGIPRDATHLIGHNRINAIKRPHCPGVTFPWQRLLIDINK